MKTVSKVAVLAMTLALAGALTACGSNASSSAAASSAASSSAAASSAAASSAAASTSASAASASTTSASASSEAPDLYQNEFFGIDFELPAGWKFVDANALSDVNAQIASAAGNGEIDMVAASGDGTSLVIVTIEDAAGQTADAHLEAAVDAILSSATGNHSYTSESATVSFGDRQLPASITKLATDGTEVWIGQACDGKDNYFFDITVLGTSEDSVMNTFSAFKGATS